jgi:lipoyl(octanoyl) transferase
MQSHYLGKTSLLHSLRAQEEAYVAVTQGRPGVVLGFECEKTITLGRRARQEVDLAYSQDELVQNGFSLINVDRGGQATLHNPGQLVVFPVVRVRDLGARAWICALAKTTRECLAQFGQESHWDEARPGVYTDKGKIASVGVRIRNGISTHGVAINVRNSLADFNAIRVCGIKAAELDQLGGEVPLPDIFASWMEHFKNQWGQAAPRC